MGYPHYEIHLAKTSGGWKTLYQAHKTAYESVEGLLDLLNKNEKSTTLYDEYGKTYTIEEFYNRVVLFDREEWGSKIRKWNDDKDMIDHVEYRRTHHNEYRYCQDIKDWHDKDNFDFTEGDFS